MPQFTLVLAKDNEDFTNYVAAAGPNINTSYVHLNSPSQLEEFDAIDYEITALEYTDNAREHPDFRDLEELCFLKMQDAQNPNKPND